jgi:hypothetical protein
MEAGRRYNIKDHYNNVENHSVGKKTKNESKINTNRLKGEFGFVKSGYCKITNDHHCIKVIKKSKFSQDVINVKIEQLNMLKTFVWCKMKFLFLLTQAIEQLVYF